MASRPAVGLVVAVMDPIRQQGVDREGAALLSACQSDQQPDRQPGVLQAAQVAGKEWGGGMLSHQK
ncbi:hypothetical protein MHAEM_21116 [Mycolicibacterium phlei]|nr:hypothetical protein [Mycolicibacterium phlei]